MEGGSQCEREKLRVCTTFLLTCRENDLLKDQLKKMVQRRDTSTRTGDPSKSLLPHTGPDITLHLPPLQTTALFMDWRRHCPLSLPPPPPVVLRPPQKINYQRSAMIVAMTTTLALHVCMSYSLLTAPPTYHTPGRKLS